MKDLPGLAGTNSLKLFALRESRRGHWRLGGLQKWSPGAPRWSSGASKIGPGAFKIRPNWLRINQKGNLEALKHPKRAKQSPGKRPGSAPGSQNGSQEAPGHPQILPKWRQHGVKMGSKTGPTWDQIPSAQKHRFFIEF